MGTRHCTLHHSAPSCVCNMAGGHPEAPRPLLSQHDAHLRCLGCWSSCSDSEFSSLRRGSLPLPAPPLPPGPTTPAGDSRARCLSQQQADSRLSLLDDTLGPLMLPRLATPGSRLSSASAQLCCTTRGGCAVAQRLRTGWLEHSAGLALCMYQTCSRKCIQEYSRLCTLFPDFRERHSEGSKPTEERCRCACLQAAQYARTTRWGRLRAIIPLPGLHHTAAAAGEARWVQQECCAGACALIDSHAGHVVYAETC